MSQTVRTTKATGKATKTSGLERAVEIAQRDGLEVVGHGTRKRDGAAVYAVPSRKEANRLHLVAVEGKRLSCDCAAGQHGRVCAHRATVYLFLLARVERASEQRPAHETAPLARSNAPFSVWK